MGISWPDAVKAAIKPKDIIVLTIDNLKAIKKNAYYYYSYQQSLKIKYEGTQWIGKSING